MYINTLQFTHLDTYLTRLTIHDEDYDENYDVYDFHVGRLTFRVSEQDARYLKDHFGVKEAR